MGNKPVGNKSVGNISQGVTYTILIWTGVALVGLLKTTNEQLQYMQGSLLLIKIYITQRHDVQILTIIGDKITRHLLEMYNGLGPVWVLKPQP